MIAPLRQRHRMWITGLTLLVPTVCTLALWSRPPAPAGSGGDTSPVALPVATGARVVETLQGFRTAVRGESGGARLEVEALKPLRHPDLLLYFASAVGSETLPADAHLLGSVAHRQRRSFPLPTAAAQGGHLVLYSLAHQTVVASSTLEALPEANPPAAAPIEAAAEGSAETQEAPEGES